MHVHTLPNLRNTLNLPGFLHVIDDPLCYPSTLKGTWHPTVPTEMDKDLPDLLHRDPVPDGATDMTRQLCVSIDAGERSDGHERPIASRQALARPEAAPGSSRRQSLNRSRKLSGSGESEVDKGV